MRKRLRSGLTESLALVAAALLVSPTLTAFAQTGATESLLIGPGDLIQVDVLDTPEMEQQARVDDTGSVPLAYIGGVHVSGETPGQAGAAIQQMLIDKGVMRHPQVTVRVEEYATQDVSILGQVKNPGNYSVTTPQSILKVISLAGGLTDAADRHIAIKHPGSAEATVYYLANDAKEAISDAPMVGPGDTVLVAKAPIVYVLGDVQRPGGYEIGTNDSRLTVMQAITLAGSANKTSVQKHTRLIRITPQGTVEMPIRLDEIEKGKEPDIALQANDVLYIPFSWLKNAALSTSQVVASTGSAAIYLAR